MRSLKVLMFSFLILLIGSCVLFAQKSFEGIVDLNYKGNKGDNTIKYYSKNGMVRLEMGENAKLDDKSPRTGTIILRDKKLFMLIPENKTYVERPLNLKEQINKLNRKTDVAKTLTKTGQQKDILGYKADQWTFKDNRGEIEIWSTDQLGNIAALENLGGLSQENMPGWLRELSEKGFFPLLVIQHGQNGEELNRLEVKDIEEKSLEIGLFEIPSDYKKMNMQHGSFHNDGKSAK